MEREKEIDYRRMANTCEMYYGCGCCPYSPEDISRFIGDRWIGGCPDYDRKLVYALGKGYRKIPEGAVVLTKEEAKGYDEYKAILAEAESPRNAAFYQLGQKRHDEIAKETAREILQEIWNKSTSLDEDNNGDLTVIEWDGLSRKDFDEIAEKYGIEVE